MWMQRWSCVHSKNGALMLENKWYIQDAHVVTYTYSSSVFRYHLSLRSYLLSACFFWLNSHFGWSCMTLCCRCSPSSFGNQYNPPWSGCTGSPGSWASRTEPRPHSPHEQSYSDWSACWAQDSRCCTHNSDLGSLCLHKTRSVDNNRCWVETVNLIQPTKWYTVCLHFWAHFWIVQRLK